MRATAQDGMITRARHFTMVPDDLITDRRVSHLGVRLWCRLDRYTNDAGQTLPAWETLASNIGCSPVTVKRLFTELVETGWIIRVEAGYVLVDEVTS